MANNNLLFSEVIPSLSDQEHDWLKQQLEYVYVVGDREYTDRDVPLDLPDGAVAWEGCRIFRPHEEGDDESAEFEFVFEEEADGSWGRHLWLYAEESGDPGQVAHLVQQFLKKFRPDQCWSLTYATTCSKPRVGEFGGGGLFVTADSIEAFDANDWVQEKCGAFVGRPKLCDCQLPGMFFSGVPGILAQVENGRLVAGAKVERCDQCQRFESDEAARQHLVELGIAPSGL